MRTTLMPIASFKCIVASAIVLAGANVSCGGMNIVSPPQVASNELYITSTTDFAHAIEYQFVIKKEKAEHLPKWSPTEKIPLAPDKAAIIALKWYKTSYPEARTVQILGISIDVIQETERSHWCFSFVISTTDEAEIKRLGHAIPIAIVLLDGTVVEPKAIGACRDYTPEPPNKASEPSVAPAPQVQR